MHLTRTGRALLAGALGLLVVALPAGQRALLGLGLAAVVAVVIAALLVVEAPRLEVRRQARPTEVDRGGAAEVTLTFEGTALRGRPFIVVETVAGSRRSAAMPALRTGERSSLAYALDTSRRGRVVAGPLRLRRTDPLGLVVAERRIAGTVTVQVRPRRLRVGMLPSGRQRDLEGPTREISRGTASFHQLRDYVPGDDLRHVHWRASARTGDLIVREHVDTTRPEVVVVVDNRAAAVSEVDFEEVVDVAASVLDAADRAGFPTTLHFADGRGTEDPDGRPVAHLDRLTVVGRSDADSLGALADALTARGRSLIFVGSHLDARDLQLVGRIAAGFSPAHLVSVMGHRDAPFVAPPGVHGLPCASAEAFVTVWDGVR